jgi:hypothetical protein
MTEMELAVATVVDYLLDKTLLKTSPRAMVIGLEVFSPFYKTLSHFFRTMLTLAERKCHNLYATRNTNKERRDINLVPHRKLTHK